MFSRFISLLVVVAILSISTASAQNPAADLGGTSWQFVKFQSGDDKTLTPDDKAKYTITFEANNHMSVRIDCNRSSGTWKSSGPNQLQFGPLALTRAMCSPSPLNDRIVKDWSFVRSYTIKERHLFLSLQADGGAHEFEPKPAVTSVGPVEFACTQAGDPMHVESDVLRNQTGSGSRVERDNQTRPAFQVRSADGAKYEGQDLLFWDARGEAMVTWSGIDLKCKRR